MACLPSLTRSGVWCCAFMLAAAGWRGRRWSSCPVSSGACRHPTLLPLLLYGEGGSRLRWWMAVLQALPAATRGVRTALYRTYPAFLHLACHHTFHLRYLCYLSLPSFTSSPVRLATSAAYKSPVALRRCLRLSPATCSRLPLVVTFLPLSHLLYDVLPAIPWRDGSSSPVCGYFRNGCSGCRGLVLCKPLRKKNLLPPQ